MCDNGLPYFTICIPTYNRAHTLTRCLDSLISQTIHDFEVVLIDDGSTDNTKQIVEQYSDSLNLIYIKKTNGGKHTALNKGILSSSDTELFMILDSDDWLTPNALETFKLLWESIDVDERKKYCGVMARCADQTGRFIGERFPKEQMCIDYVQFHFGRHVYRDCNECIRTEILKKYKYPEPDGTRFVPEYYVFDQIGLEYLLLCVNQVTERKEYLNDGITNNYSEFFKKNCIGYTYGLSCRIEKIFPFYKGRIPFLKRIMVWYEYWYACYYDSENKGARVSHITLCGLIGKCRFLAKRALVVCGIKEMT